MSQQTSISNLTPSDAASDIGRIDFIVRSLMSGLRTAIPVKVISCSNDGGVSPIGYLTVQPMVNSLNGAGQAVPHGQIQNVPYMRIQGGTNAVIIDPVAGDIGIATVCDRDISVVKKSQSISSPGSNRKNSMSDMIYLMTIIGAAPSQYIQFNTDGGGIEITSPCQVNINAPSVSTSSNFSVGAGATGSFTTPTGQTVSVQSGVIINIF